METSRRGFLRGLAALAGAVGIGAALPTPRVEAAPQPELTANLIANYVTTQRQTERIARARTAMTSFGGLTDKQKKAWAESLWNEGRDTSFSFTRPRT